MSGTNDFLPIAIDPSAAVLSQAAWAAATPSPAVGRGAGIFPKEWYNKAARQASVMAAAIGGFLNGQSQNALDDGNVPNLTAAILAAIKAVVTSQATASAPVANAAYNTNIAVHTLSTTLSLPVGTWLVQASASIFTSIYYQQQLRINGTVVMTIPNLGDQAGTDFVPMAGFLSVVNAGPGNLSCVIDYVQESGGSNSPFYMGGIAFKTA
jgi:hypothetical protein